MNMKLPYVEQFHQNRQKVKQKDPPAGNQNAAVAAQNDPRNRGRQEPNSHKKAQPAGLANSNNQAGQPQFVNGAVGGAGSGRQAVAGGRNGAGGRAVQVQQPGANQQQSKRRESICDDEAGRQKIKSIRSKKGKNESQDSLIGPNSLNNGVQGMQAPEPKDNNKDIRFQSGLKVKSQVASNNGGGSNLKASSRLAGVNSSRASARNRDPKNYAAGGGF